MTGSMAVRSRSMMKRPLSASCSSWKPMPSYSALLSVPTTLGGRVLYAVAMTGCGLMLAEGTSCPRPPGWAELAPST
jgi:hypothetical protein